MPPMLSVENLSITYGNQEEFAVEGVSLHMKKGDIIAIAGESGAGKTSVIRAVLGSLPAGGRISGGDILFEGKSLLGYEKEEFRQLRGNRISMIFQNSGAMINPIRKIGSQYVEYIRTHENISKKEAWEKGEDMLKKMRLPDADHVMKSYPFRLSGGMCQRVGIAMAMTFKPDLLLADEPTSALDVTTQTQIVRQMMELRDIYGTGIIIVTHNIGVAAYMSDNIIIMKNGRIVETGDREKILKSPEDPYTENLLTSVPSMGGGRFV